MRSACSSENCIFVPCFEICCVDGHARPRPQHRMPFMDVDCCGRCARAVASCGAGMGGCGLWLAGMTPGACASFSRFCASGAEQGVLWRAFFGLLYSRGRPSPYSWPLSFRTQNVLWLMTCGFEKRDSPRLLLACICRSPMTRIRCRSRAKLRKRRTRMSLSCHRRTKAPKICISQCGGREGSRNIDAGMTPLLLLMMPMPIGFIR